MQNGTIGLQVFTTVTQSPAGHNIEHTSADVRDNITLLAICQLWPVKAWFDLTERGLYIAKRLKHMQDASDGQLRIIKSAADLNAVVDARKTGTDVSGASLG
jgi:hypothetical protein